MSSELLSSSGAARRGGSPQLRTSLSSYFSELFSSLGLGLVETIAESGRGNVNGANEPVAAKAEWRRRAVESAFGERSRSDRPL